MAKDTNAKKDDTIMSMYDFAKSELDRAGYTTHPEPEARKVASDVLSLVKRFEKQGHSEYTKDVVLEWFASLTNFVPLAPITDNPDDWERFEITTKNSKGEETVKELWQSRRAPSVISEDGGKTFVDQKTGNGGPSQPHEDWLKHLAEQHQKAIARMEEKKNPKKDPAANVKATPPTEGEAPAEESK